MPGIKSKVFRYSVKQENMNHNEKKTQLIKTDTELTYIKELNKHIK